MLVNKNKMVENTVMGCFCLSKAPRIETFHQSQQTLCPEFNYWVTQADLMDVSNGVGTHSRAQNCDTLVFLSEPLKHHASQFYLPSPFVLLTVLKIVEQLHKILIELLVLQIHLNRKHQDVNRLGLILLFANAWSQDSPQAPIVPQYLKKSSPSFQSH